MKNSTVSNRNAGMKLLLAALSTITVALTSGSEIISPTPLKVISLVLFVAAATLQWSAYFKYRGKYKKGDEIEV